MNSELVELIDNAMRSVWRAEQAPNGVDAAYAPAVIKALSDAARLHDECAAKHCEAEATLGMTWRFNDVRIEFYLCERHFDEVSAVDEVGPPESRET